jgi:hypothetical protein
MSVEYGGPTEFVHLHCHTVYSTLDGVQTPEQLFRTCAERGWPAVAITEHGKLNSVPDCYFASKDSGVQYIPGCFLPEQPVYCKSGVNNINKIKPGEYVLTHLNRFKKVLNTQVKNFDGDMAVVKAWGVEPITCTPEHPLLVRSVERLEVKKGVWRECIDRKFMKASELSRIKYNRTYSTKRSKDRSNKRRYGYYLCVPRLTSKGLKPVSLEHFAFKQDAVLNISNNIIENVTYERAGYKATFPVQLPTHIELDEEFLWVCGLWLAEGSIKTDSSIEFTLGGGEMHFAQRVLSYFNKLGVCTNIRQRLDKNTIDISVSSAYLSRVFVCLFGCGFAEKKLTNDWLFGLNKNQTIALLNGIFDGDAKVGARQSYLKMCNRTLIWQVRLLLTRVAQYSAISQIKNNNSENIGYVVRRRESGHCYYDWDNEYIYLPVYDVSVAHYSGLVYNLEVEDDNTYNVGVAVHNCEVYFNDYEPIRQEMAARGEKMSSIKQSDPDLYTRIMRNRHLTVLAKNMTGFHNLVKMTTEAFKFGFYSRPRVWFDKLLEYKEGLIILTGCFNGPASYEIGRNLMRIKENSPYHEKNGPRDKKGAIDYIKKFKDAFGDDLYIEVQMPCLAQHEEDIDDRKHFWLLLKMAEKFGIKAVLTNDVHYLDQAGFETQKLMMAIGQNVTIDSPDLFHANSNEQYLKTRADLWHTFKTMGYDKHATDAQFEAMCDNTLLVAEKCGKFTPDLEPKIPTNEGDPEKLKRIVVSELMKRGLHKCTKKYVVDNLEVTYFDQVKIELNRFIEKGFASYFLITQDLVRYSVEVLKAPVGPRGSVGGSLVCHLLGITELDPLKWGLSFNRFLSPSRGGFMLNIKAK